MIIIEAIHTFCGKIDYTIVLFLEKVDRKDKGWIERERAKE